MTDTIVEILFSIFERRKLAVPENRVPPCSAASLVKLFPRRCSSGILVGPPTTAYLSRENRPTYVFLTPEPVRDVFDLVNDVGAS